VDVPNLQNCIQSTESLEVQDTHNVFVSHSKLTVKEEQLSNDFNAKNCLKTVCSTESETGALTVCANCAELVCTGPILNLELKSQTASM
jgi:hypothetical protein